MGYRIITRPPLIDTHAHLTDEVFNNDLGEVLERAASHGVHWVICMSENLTEAKKCLEISEKFERICPAAGMFPTFLDLTESAELIELIRANADKLFAIGEIGLDYWKVKTPEALEIQEHIFRTYIRLAKELDLPISVHSRSAGERTIQVLLEEDAKNVQLHAFDGRFVTASKAVEAGYYFSVPPSIVRVRQKQKLFKQMPVKHILLETDSPVMAVNPEDRNEPSEVLTSLKAIAEIKGLHFLEMWNHVCLNQSVLFKKIYSVKTLRRNEIEI